MGLRTNLEIYQVSRDLEFDDLSLLNDRLENQGSGTFQELYSETGIGHPDWQGVFRFHKGKFEIAKLDDGGFKGYGNSTCLWTAIWAKYHDKMWKLIAQHIVLGKLVLHIDSIEKDENLYVVMESGSYKVYSEAALRPVF